MQKKFGAQMICHDALDSQDIEGTWLWNHAFFVPLSALAGVVG